MGGKFHPKLNTGKRPIANKYCEGKMKRTLKRELKVPEIVNRETMECGHRLLGNQSERETWPVHLPCERVNINLSGRRWTAGEVGSCLWMLLFINCGTLLSDGLRTQTYASRRGRALRCALHCWTENQCCGVRCGGSVLPHCTLGMLT